MTTHRVKTCLLVLLLILFQSFSVSHPANSLPKWNLNKKPMASSARPASLSCTNSNSDAGADSDNADDDDDDDNAESASKDEKTEQDKKGSDSGSQAKSKKQKGKSGKASEKKAEKKTDDELSKLSVTEHKITIAGKEIKYKATAGFMILRDYSAKKAQEEKEKDKDKDSDRKKEPKALAKVFFIAYTREDAGSVQKRPLTFAFNGGPGSASIWLHMGGLGPRRAVLSENGEALPPPYRLEDNPYSWIESSDLVFIDPVSTGYSRPEPGEDPKKFHGYTEDIESVSEFIRLYITKYQRWSSPKFIAGESYGTTRAAGLSNHLQKRYGLYFNGIILVSTVLNFATLEFDSGNNLPYVMFLPAYAATAWYHKKLPAEMQNKPLNEFLSEVETFANKDYLADLFQGDRIGADRQEELSRRLSSYIGLPSGYIKQLGNKVEDSLFFTHLLSAENRVLGRYDSRFTGIRHNPGTDRYDFDPSGEAVTGTFTAAFNDYVRRELKFESEFPYETLANVWPWSYRNAENRYLDVSDDLRKAMSRNPYLKVWLACGYYDLATPYFASKYTVDQLSLDPAIRKNIRLTYYPSGHMMYIYKPALIKFKEDFQNFLKDSILPETQVFKNTEP